MHTETSIALLAIWVLKCTLLACRGYVVKPGSISALFTNNTRCLTSTEGLECQIFSCCIESYNHIILEVERILCINAFAAISNIANSTLNSSEVPESTAALWNTVVNKLRLRK